MESLGPTSPPYWVLGLWNAQGSPIGGHDKGSYAYALVYACVGSPLLGEYTCFAPILAQFGLKTVTLAGTFSRASQRFPRGCTRNAISLLSRCVLVSTSKGLQVTFSDPGWLGGCCGRRCENSLHIGIFPCRL